MSDVETTRATDEITVTVDAALPTQRAHPAHPAVPATAPYRIVDETWLIANLAPAGPGVFLPVNSMLIRGSEPVIVDTGAPIHRDSVLSQVFSLVEPEDVKWIYLSHDDGDHTGALHELLERCPNATLVVNFFITERLALEKALPVDRMVWLGPGDVLDVGDRTLHLVVPPIFDGPTTRALFDEKSRVLWSVDSFAALSPGAVHEHSDIPAEMYDATFQLLNSLISPWHQWLDQDKYSRHVHDLARLEPEATASAHGPVLRGAAIDDAFARVCAMAGRDIVPPPGQEMLDDLVAQLTAEP
jgi:flavorubredoxin